MKQTDLLLRIRTLHYHGDIRLGGIDATLTFIFRFFFLRQGLDLNKWLRLLNRDRHGLVLVADALLLPKSRHLVEVGTVFALDFKRRFERCCLGSKREKLLLENCETLLSLVVNHNQDLLEILNLVDKALALFFESGIFLLELRELGRLSGLHLGGHRKCRLGRD